MYENQPVFIRIAKIVAASGVAAGIAGGVAGLLVPRKRAPESRLSSLRARTPKIEKVRAQVRAAAPSETGKAIRQSLQNASVSGAVDRKRLNAMKKSATKDANRLVDRLRDTAAEGRDKLSHVAAETIHEAADMLAYVTEDSKDVTGRARNILDQQRSVAADQAMRIREQSGEHLSDLEKQLADALESKVKPSLAKAGRNAGHAAEELRSRLNSQLDHLGEVADERRPQLSGAAEQLSDRIAHLLKDADATGDDWRQTAEQALHDAEHIIQDNAHAARKFAGDVGDSAKEGGKNFGSLLFWLTVAGGLIYAFLMDEEQKRKSRELASAAFHEGSELYRDVRGRNADFPQ